MEEVNDADVAYTVLMSLGEKFSPLMVTLTNMSPKDSPLSLTGVDNEAHVNNPLGYKSDTVFRGDLHHTTLQVVRANSSAQHRTVP